MGAVQKVVEGGAPSKGAEADRARMEAIARFVSASQQYRKDGSRDVEAISSRFFKKFLEDKPRRAKAAHRHAREGVDLLRGFSSIDASLMSKAALLSNVEQLAATEIARKFMEKVVAEAFPALPPPRPGGDPTLDLLTWDKRRKMARAALEDARDLADQRVMATAGFGIKVLSIATRLYEERQVTTRTFAVTHVRPSSWREVVSQVAELVVDDLWDDAIKEAWKAVVERTAELLTLTVGPESPVWWGPKVLKALPKIFKRREIDTSPGATDLMLRLVEKLRAENALFDEIDRAYKLALDELERLSRLPL
jgi:hypothetical protein